MSIKENRAEYLDLLRRMPEDKHIKGAYFSHTRDAFCALGVYMFWKDVTASNMERQLGLSTPLVEKIADWNDNHHLTFAQIADRLEGEFATEGGTSMTPDTATKRYIRESLEPLFAEAEEKGLWFRTLALGLWLSPRELKQHQARGRFVWGPANWELRDPREHISYLEENIQSAEKALSDFQARIAAEETPS